jgi:hypothetical protein
MRRHLDAGSYDPTLDLVYWAIGNPCPDIAGEERIGDNLYTSSVVALSAKTGALKWYYQFTPHDTHDWDAVQPMLLVDEVWQGRPRKLLMHGDRNGMFYVLDRATGEFLLGDNLSTKVTWLKGFTKEGKPIVDPASIASLEGARRALRAAAAPIGPRRPTTRSRSCSTRAWPTVARCLRRTEIRWAPQAIAGSGAARHPLRRRKSCARCWMVTRPAPTFAR